MSRNGQKACFSVQKGVLTFYFGRKKIIPISSSKIILLCFLRCQKSIPAGSPSLLLVKQKGRLHEGTISHLWLGLPTDPETEHRAGGTGSIHLSFLKDPLAVVHQHLLGGGGAPRENPLLCVPRAGPGLHGSAGDLISVPAVQRNAARHCLQHEDDAVVLTCDNRPEFLRVTTKTATSSLMNINKHPPALASGKNSTSLTHPGVLSAASCCF